MSLTYFLWCLLGTGYGFVIGLVPVAGVSTALIAIFGFLDYFRHDPYSLVVFTTSIVVACAIGDNFSSIVMNIPGSAGSAATMIDGFPMAKKGLAAHALSAAIFTSVGNGLLWGAITFVFMPYYKNVVLLFNVPELLAFVLVAFTSVCFITNDKWGRGIVALLLGIFVGLIGQDPNTGAHRYTFGWDYIATGIQITPVMAGILAFPELIETYFSKKDAFVVKIIDTKKQIVDGFWDSVRYWRDGFRGGAIGAAIGLLPGVGGSVADWVAYGQTVSAHPNEKIPFGEGNIKGVIGCEGSNNAQKATGYIPTILFGIPAAPFEAIIMALFIYVGLEMGTPTLLNDSYFFDILTASYMISLVLTLIISLICIKHVDKIFKVPFKVWFWILTALITWSCVQYTGYWEDYSMLLICILVGIALKRWQFSRAAFIIGFVLSDRVEKLFYQYNTLYNWEEIFFRPISAGLIAVMLLLIIKGLFFNNTRITYS